VIDDTVNQVVEQRKRPIPADGEHTGVALPLLLFAGFRSIIDQLHAELAVRGHPDVRPAHGFALQAIGIAGVTASELGRRLGVSKQAAGKTVDRLADLGYVERADDESDGRRKLVRLTARGVDLLRTSAGIFDELRTTWVAALGASRVAELERDLRVLAPADGVRFDVAGWLSS
jgi:DNA-binding MarR family transcriptional regulator